MSVDFRRRIRDYNNALSFASMGARVDSSVAGQKGIFTFRVGGQLHHHMGSSLPKEGSAPTFAQIYVVGDGGTAEEEMRQNYHNNTLNSMILANLQMLLHEINPYSKIFKNARAVLEQNPHSKIVLKSMAPGNRHDFKRYNRPNPSDIGAIFEGTGDLDIRERHVILHAHQGDFVRVSDMNTNYLGTRYPILFARGCQGWDPYFVSPTRTKPLPMAALLSTGK